MKPTVSLSMASRPEGRCTLLRVGSRVANSLRTNKGLMTWAQQQRCDHSQCEIRLSSDGQALNDRTLVCDIAWPESAQSNAKGSSQAAS